jgi:hypothetical protein
MQPQDNTHNTINSALAKHAVKASPLEDKNKNTRRDKNKNKRRDKNNTYNSFPPSSSYVALL